MTAIATDYLRTYVVIVNYPNTADVQCVESSKFSQRTLLELRQKWLLR